MAQAEGAKFWLQVVIELKNRGVADICIACVEGPKVLPGCYCGRVSQDRCAALSGAYGAPQSELRGLETAQGSGCRFVADLRGRN